MSDVSSGQDVVCRTSSELGVPIHRWRKAMRLVTWRRRSQDEGSPNRGQGQVAPLDESLLQPGTSTSSTGSSQAKLVMNMILFRPISPLLLCLPFGLLAPLLGLRPILAFWLNLVPMIALAQILGDATEELAAGLGNETLGGLLNATFGNAIEMILTVQSLRKGMIMLVKAQLLGSVLSNLLLVLGSALFIGGLWGGPIGKVQSFNAQAAMANVTMLLLASASFALPTVFYNMPAVVAHTPKDPDDETLSVSRYASIYILMSYGAFLVYQLYTHVKLFAKDEDEEDAEEAQLSIPVAIGMLFVITAVVAASSEVLLDAIDGFVVNWGVGETFIGMILLPIAGNACEHLGAIRMAVQDKLDITIGIAVGSATQISLFVVPFAVQVGWLISQPMDLNFDPLNILVMASATIVVSSAVQDGLGTWIQGFMLVMAYFIIATLYWFMPEDPVDVDVS
mmetsp:Transcript_6528/g.11347  ORF Transcript_6528/g.11347 Transcript_6528/m.11347 type:complete len:452 (+) Transcript_6528:99-1454(+)